MAALTYPVTFEIDEPAEMERWRPLVQWFLAIPHMIIQYVLESVAAVVALISWFAIVFTGKLPQGLAQFSVMAMRYETRLTAYVGFLHKEYPPFDFTTSFEDPGGQPVRVAATPELEGRNRLTVGLRLLWAIPIILFTIVVSIAAWFVWLVAAFAVLITGSWPEGMRSFVIRTMRLWTRTTGYVVLLTDQYPPFELD